MQDKIFKFNIFRVIQNPRNLWKFSPSKNLGYMVKKLDFKTYGIYNPQVSSALTFCLGATAQDLRVTNSVVRSLAFEV